MERTRERTFRSNHPMLYPALLDLLAVAVVKETLSASSTWSVAWDRRWNRRDRNHRGNRRGRKAHAGASWGVLHRIMTAAPRHRRTCSCSSTRRHAFPIDFRSGHDVVFGRRHDLMGIAHQPFLVVGHCRELFRSRNSLVSLGERGSSSNPLYSAAFARYCSAVNMLTIFSDQARARLSLSHRCLCWVIRTVINCIWGRWRRSAIFIFDEQSYGAALPEQFYTDAIDQRAHASPGSSRRSHARRGLRQCTMRSRAGTTVPRSTNLHLREPAMSRH